MHKNGVRFIPMYGTQAFKVDGKFKFWGGLTVICSGGGAGLVTALRKTALSRDIKIRYGARATRLIYDGSRISGVAIRTAEGEEIIKARATVLACGGFGSNTEWRTRYLGPGWDLAKVRGTRFNNGDGIQMAFDVGAVPYGHWSGCHAVGWDMNAPQYGDLSVGDSFQKHCYQFGIMVNANGKRFVDEGADFRNFTYAKYGRAVLEQPFQFAWQVFDQKAKPLLRDEYHIRRITKVTGGTLEELASKLEGVNPTAFLEEVRRYNAAVRTDIPFNANVKDGRSADGLEVPRANWANTIDEPPFEAYGITCGVTFTFGGIKVDTSARVINVDEAPITGLYSAGEMVGGLFYFNYGGGTGLVSGAVFGRVAGAEAAKHALQ
jgi:tricarballylate dehydrogenase